MAPAQAGRGIIAAAMTHLTSRQLFAVRMGTPLTPADGRHAATCSACRARLALMNQDRAQTAEGRGSHPDAEALASFVDGALPSAVAAGLEQHLANCAACEAVVTTVREAFRAPVGDAPPDALLDKVKHDFRSAR